MLKGNKGEWSEVYTFFKLLADGKLYSADEHLNKTSAYINILSINRLHQTSSLEYEVQSPMINVIDVSTQSIIVSITQAEALKISSELFNEIDSAGGSSFGISQTLENKIAGYKIDKVKEKSGNKGDINIFIHDPKNGVSTKKKFSIKSFIGSTPTIFNANMTTNIIYEIIDNNGTRLPNAEISRINAIVTNHKYIDRITEIQRLGYSIKYSSFEDSTFRLNLELIDSKLPEIVAFIVKQKFTHRISKINEVIDSLNKNNPIGYDLSEGHNFYEYRIINFLMEATLGMTSTTVWSGVYDVIGGLIIVKNNADVVCFHLVDFNKFKSYLKNSAKLDNPSGSKMGYGVVYEKNNKSFIKLNFQIKA